MIEQIRTNIVQVQAVKSEDSLSFIFQIEEQITIPDSTQRKLTDVQTPKERSNYRLVKQRENRNQSNISFQEREQLIPQQQNEIAQLEQKIIQIDTLDKTNTTPTDYVKENKQIRFRQQQQQEYIDSALLNEAMVCKQIQIPYMKIKDKQLLCCILKVNKRSNILSPHTYELYLQQQKKRILQATKQSFKNTFIIQKTSAIIRSSLSRTHYVLQDQYERAYLHFDSNLFGLSQQKVLVVTSKIKFHKQQQQFSRLKTCYDQCQFSRINLFRQRKAIKGLNGKYELDFKGMKVEGSNKNMILQSQNGGGSVIFCKQKQGLYYLYIGYPFSVIQGFFVGLCCLDKKILVN